MSGTFALNIEGFVLRKVLNLSQQGKLSETQHDVRERITISHCRVGRDMPEGHGLV